MKILVLGAGPFTIDEGGELDAAVAKGCLALRARGHEVVVVSSSPQAASNAPAFADRTYLEPLDVDAVAAISALEKPDRVYPLLGGRPALALALALHERTGVSPWGIDVETLRRVLAIDAAARRREVLASEGSWTTVEVVLSIGERVALAGIVESLDRSGVHPADSICVCPSVSLTETERAALASAGEAAAAEIGASHTVVTIELALERSSGRTEVLDIAPGISRATALLSRTGDADVSVSAIARLLREPMPAPSTLAPQYVVRWPRFAFETFRDADASLGPERKSVGDAVGTAPTVAGALRVAARAADDGLAFPRPSPTAGAATDVRVVVVGAGPARIGSGAELAVSAHEAVQALHAAGLEPVYVDASLSAAIRVASNPPASRERLAPVTLEHVLAVCAETKARRAVVHVGGDAALRLAAGLTANGVEVLGTSPEAIARALAIRAAAPDDARGFDVEALGDGKRVVIAGVMEHLEPAFVHGGDAAAILPPSQAEPELVARIEDRVRELALDLGVRGCLAVRVAVAGSEIHVLAVEPRAGRTTAFVARATGVPIVAIATQVMLGKSLDALGVAQRPIPRHVAARERVFPFARLGIDPALRAEMRSTGEAIGIADTPARAYAKALRGIGFDLAAPNARRGGTRGVLLDVTEEDRNAAIELARRLRAIGFEVHARAATRAALAASRIPFVDAGEGSANDAATVDGSTLAFAVVTARTVAEIARTRALRAGAQAARIPCFTTVALAKLACAALEDGAPPTVRSLEAWYREDA